jgi:hypothetical protein
MPPAPHSQVKRDQNQDDILKKLKLVRAGHSIAGNLAQGDVDKAFSKVIVSGIKLASLNPFADPNVNPLTLASHLKTLGIAVLGWAPETLFSTIDRMYFGWTAERAAAALEKFQETGVMQTDVPLMVRQKIYAIRIIATSDTAHNEWHVFEKVGSAFNDRVAKFGIVEKLSPGECARTIAIIEDIRPDDYSDEIKVYIAATSHEDGILTLSPSKYLYMAESRLTQMNHDSMGTLVPQDIRDKIRKKLELLKTNSGKIEPGDDLITIQALKLLAIDQMGEDAANGK